MKYFSEYLVKCLSKTAIFEMAYDRKQFFQAVDNLVFQLVENWCLVRSCYYKNNINKQHWQSELNAHISNIRKRVVKIDKRKVVTEVFIKCNELDMPGRVLDVITEKFYKENIDKNIAYKCAVDFAENVDNFIDVLGAEFVSPNINNVIEYIEKI